MDIDAILARHPKLVLVDELAHTKRARKPSPETLPRCRGIAGSRDSIVYTTVNIQHIDSLNDIVARITHTRVRETVPDSIIDHADDIEVIDLTPDDLLARLREGKVYVGDRAARAIGGIISRAAI